MLIGITGMYASGKTTWLNAARDYWPSQCKYSLICVSADNAFEYIYDMNGDCWVLTTGRKSIWKDTKRDKSQALRDMILDRACIYIVESARYFSGMQDVILSAHNAGKGGVRFVVVMVQPDVCRQFLIERCNRFGKTFNESYWNYAKLLYEGGSRYVNAMKHHYIPAYIPVEFIAIDADRNNWGLATNIISRWVLDDIKSWYNENRSN